MVKKIIITIILIVFLLFIQSYVFSESCSLTASDNSLKTVTLGCLGEGDVVNCYFTMFNNSDILSGFDSGVDTCKQEYVNQQGSYTYSDYRSCIEDVIENFVNLENSNSGNQSSNQECIEVCGQENDDCKFDCYDDPSCLDECDVEYQECIDQCNSTNNSGNSSGNSNYSPIYLEDNLDFELDSCNYQNVKTNLELITDLSFEMKNNIIELSLSGIDNLIVKEKNIDVYVNNNNYLGPATFNFDIDSLIIEGDSNVSLRTKARNDCGEIEYIQFSQNLKKPYYTNNPLLNSLILNLNNLILREFSDLKLGIKTEKMNSYCLIGRSGGDVKLDINNVFNEGILNIDLISADSGKVEMPDNCDEKNGGHSENAGDVNLYINKIYNKNKFAVNIKSGTGNVGARGSNAPATGSGSCSLSTKPGWGGDGGNGGNVSFKVKHIENFDVLDINLISGNGGKGADTGFDGGANSNQADYAEGGNGGSGGNIYLDQFPLSVYNYNNGKINFYFSAGNGNDGGNKSNRLEEGKAGDGGDGGNIDKIYFDVIENNDFFNLNFTPGNKGLKGTTTGGENGSNGGPLNLDINYLINKSEEFSIVLNNNYEDLRPSTILIKKLHTASYLPKKLSLYTEGDTLLQNKNIKINRTCYIKKPNSNLDYFAGNIYIYSANKNTFKDYIITPEGSTKNFTDNSDCSVCDYIDLENPSEIFPSNTGHKFRQTYSLFSNNEGSIESGNLEIYYAKNNSSFTKITTYNPFLKEEKPLYTNKAPINSQLNEKTGLYEYKISPENLSWYFNLEKDLTEKEIYCYFQNYRIEGKIKLNNNTEKTFSFPFTPIRTH